MKELARKLNFKATILRKLSAILPSYLRLLYYKTYVQPIIDYGISIWGCTSEHNISIIQRIQNCMIRIISGNYDYDVDGLSLVRDLKLYNIKERRDYFLTKLTFEAVNNIGPSYIYDNLVYNRDVSERVTRGHADLHLPRVNKSVYNNSLLLRGGRLYNELPDTIKCCNNVKDFKSLYRDHILGKLLLLDR